jgi:uncharacterized membrane protein YkoI
LALFRLDSAKPTNQISDDLTILPQELVMRKAAILGILGLLGLAATVAFIQYDASYDAKLLARARLTPAQAEAKALAAVPGGKITESELEEEDGRLIYSFDLAVAGQDRIAEVEIDAVTGEILAQEQDDDDDHGATDDDDREERKSSH